MAEALGMSQEEFDRAVTFKRIENVKSIGNSVDSLETSELKDFSYQSERNKICKKFK